MRTYFCARHVRGAPRTGALGDKLTPLYETQLRGYYDLDPGGSSVPSVKATRPGARSVPRKGLEEAAWPAPLAKPVG